MPHEILIHHAAHETRVAVHQDAQVQELHIERHAQRGIVGNVYLGKVVRILPGMQSVFVDIGTQRAGFLHIADLWQTKKHVSNLNATVSDKTLAIEKLIFEGQTLLVQVLKDPLGSKGARLSTQISLAGRYLVLLPQDQHIGLSQKIDDPAARDALRDRLNAAIPAGFKQGLIARTQALDASTEQLAQDLGYLSALWRVVQDKSTTLAPPCLLAQDLSLAQRALRDLCTEKTQAIKVDGAACYAELRAFASDYMPAVLDKLQLHSSDRPLFELARVDEETALALQKRVDLKNGGYLIIDQTEALCAVDVNTGGFVGRTQFEETILKTNLQAAVAIARQLRLRNLGGIIVLDFIDMASPAHRQQVAQALEHALAKDPVRTHIHGFTALGLMELTRKRVRESLAQQLCEPCPLCESRGKIKTAQTVAYEIMREIELESRQFNPKGFRVIAAPAVVDRLMEQEADHLAALEKLVGKPISLHVDALFAQDYYDVAMV